MTSLQHIVSEEKKRQTRSSRSGWVRRRASEFPCAGWMETGLGFGADALRPARCFCLLCPVSR